MSETMTITEFLESRIAEDEAAANVAAAWGAGGPEPHISWYGEPRDTSINAFGMAGPHVAAMSPARVLAECAAKRAIIEECDSVLGSGGWEYSDAPDLAELVLGSLAAIHRDHPDYRSEWAV